MGNLLEREDKLGHLKETMSLPELTGIGEGNASLNT